MSEKNQHIYSMGSVEASMLKKIYDKEFEEILKNFDFKKVKNVMKFLKWYWFLNNKMSIPKIKEMKYTIDEMYHKCFDNMVKNNYKYFSVETGGFRITLFNQKEFIQVKLEFILEQNLI